jgi:DNA repair photolyase
MRMYPEINAYDLCKEVIADQWDDIQPISPGSVATEMMDRFRESDPTVAYHCFLDFKAIARSFLRRLFKDKEEQLEQEHLFGDLLQARYPAKREEEEVYARLDDLTDKEVIQNIERLKSEARSKNDHAVALLGYLNQRRQKAA